MRIHRTLLLAAVAAICWSDAAGHLCSFSNKGGNLTTFFNSFSGIATFPCSYQLAELKCGNLQTEVSVVNKVNDAGELYMSSVTVDITAMGDDGKKEFKRTNILTEKGWLAKQSSEAWTWVNRGDKELDESIVQRGYSSDKRYYYIMYADFKVTFSVPDDVINVTCKEGGVTEAVRFPETLCGSPDNAAADVTALDSYLPSDTMNDKSGARMDYVQLVLQGAKQTDKWCMEAKKIVKKGCDNKGEQLYQCNKMYNPHLPHGKCLREKFDAFRSYMTCVGAFCAKKGCVDKKSCGLLSQVSSACAATGGGDFAQKAGCSEEPWNTNPKC